MACRMHYGMSGAVAGGAERRRASIAVPSLTRRGHFGDRHGLVVPRSGMWVASSGAVDLSGGRGPGRR